MHQLDGWCSDFKASTLMDLVFFLHPRTIVEIGVFGGKSLVPMAFAMKAINEGGMVYGIDPWSCAASAEGQIGVDKDYWGSLDHDAILARLQSKITDFQLHNHITLVRATSEEAAPIPNIDILHIDGNHSDDASYFDTIKWVSLVRTGGMIVFDDITWSTIDRATKWLNENCIQLVTIQDEANSWGVWIKP
jgi:predicted O-methyltransferase YrrM